MSGSTAAVGANLPDLQAGRNLSDAPRVPVPLELKHVTRWYGDVLALDGVDLRIGPGVTGLLGPNGAGKSTLIRLLVGLAAPDDGEVLLDGRPIRNDVATLARIGYVPDGEGLHEELSARRFLQQQALLRGFTAQSAALRVDQCLRRVGLHDAADARAGSYSKGMRQRMKLAAALLHDPDLLVLDEPLNGLDPVMRRGFIRVIRELGDEGVTVLVSSHVLHEVERMTDQVVLLHHGQVLAEGAVGHIRDLLEAQARRIRVTTPDPRGLARRLLEHQNLLTALELAADALVLETLRPDRTCALVQELAAAGAIDVTGLEPLDDDLDAVFGYLVR